MIKRSIIQTVSIFVLAMIVTACTQEPILDIEEQAQANIEARNGDPCGGYNSIPLAQQAPGCAVRINNLCENFSSTLTGPGFSWECALGDCKNFYDINIPSNGSYVWTVYTRTGIPMDTKTMYFNACGNDGNGGNTPDSSTCDTPDVDITNIKRRRVTARWNAVPNAIRYQVRYRKAGTQAWTVRGTTSTSRNLGSLNPNTNYQYQSRTKCSSWTSWTASDTFRTR